MTFYLINLLQRTTTFLWAVAEDPAMPTDVQAQAGALADEIAEALDPEEKEGA